MPSMLAIRYEPKTVTIRNSSDGRCLQPDKTVAQTYSWHMAISSGFTSMALNLNNALFAHEKFDIGNK